MSNYKLFKFRKKKIIMKYSTFLLIILMSVLFACNSKKKSNDTNVFKSDIIEDEPKSQDD